MSNSKRNVNVAAAKKGATASKKGADKKVTAPAVVAAKVVAPAVAAPKARSAFIPVSATFYSGLRGVSKGAYTIAALVVAGMAKVNGDEIAKGDSPSIGLFRAIVGDTPIGYHRKGGNIKGSALTAEGIAFFNARLSGNAPTFNTDPETMRAFVAAMSKGGKVEIGADSVEFTKKLSVTEA
jgi:hypothetical protein